MPLIGVEREKSMALGYEAEYGYTVGIVTW